MESPMNTIKDGYLRSVDWIEMHPHSTLWCAVAAIAVAIVLL